MWVGVSFVFLRVGEKNKINSLKFALTYQKAKSFLSLLIITIVSVCRLSFYTCCQRLTIWPVRDCGQFSIRLHEKLKRATNLRIPLKPLLAILCVTNWPLFIFNQLTINFALPRALGQTHSLTSFGRAVGFLSDLAMCVAVKRWHYLIAYFLSLCLNASFPPSKISQTCSFIPC